MSSLYTMNHALGAGLVLLAATGLAMPTASQAKVEGRDSHTTADVALRDSGTKGSFEAVSISHQTNYLTEITIGGQNLTVLLDTGSPTMSVILQL